MAQNTLSPHFFQNPPRQGASAAQSELPPEQPFSGYLKNAEGQQLVASSDEASTPIPKKKPRSIDDPVDPLPATAPGPMFLADTLLLVQKGFYALQEGLIEAVSAVVRDHALPPIGQTTQLTFSTPVMGVHHVDITRTETGVKIGLKVSSELGAILVGSHLETLTQAVQSVMGFPVQLQVTSLGSSFQESGQDRERKRAPVVVSEALSSGQAEGELFEAYLASSETQGRMGP